MIDLSRLYHRRLRRGASPLKEAAWWVVRAFFFLTPLPWPSALRVALLQLFGATVGEGVVIRSHVNITFPWRFTAGNHVWIGEEALILSLAPVDIESNCCISQRAFLCTGSHDFSSPAFTLRTGAITIREGSWVAAAAFIGARRAGGAGQHGYGRKRGHRRRCAPGHRARQSRLGDQAATSGKIQIPSYPSCASFSSTNISRRTRPRPVSCCERWPMRWRRQGMKWCSPPPGQDYRAGQKRGSRYAAGDRRALGAISRRAAAPGRWMPWFRRLRRRCWSWSGRSLRNCAGPGITIGFSTCIRSLRRPWVKSRTGRLTRLFSAATRWAYRRRRLRGGAG